MLVHEIVELINFRSYWLSPKVYEIGVRFILGGLQNTSVYNNIIIIYDATNKQQRNKQSMLNIMFLYICYSNISYDLVKHSTHIPRNIHDNLRNSTMAQPNNNLKINIKYSTGFI